jgi:glucokinase-like ROK family protein
LILIIESESSIDYTKVNLPYNSEWNLTSNPRDVSISKRLHPLLSILFISLMRTINNSTNLSSQALTRMEVLDVIRAKKILSRSELADAVSASRGTVSNIVLDLLEIGLLEEIGEGKSTGGRPPIRLRYRPEGKLAIGLLLYQNQIQVVMTDLEGQPQHFFEVPVSGTSPGEMISSMRDAISQLLEDTPRERVIGIGVGAPGIVNFHTGVIEISVSMGWLEEQVFIKDFLERAFQIPVFVANRSRVAALGELKAGIGRNVSNLIYLFLGQGIVAGIVINGKLYFGSGFDSGEIGHVSIDPNGLLCACGNHGCLEAYASEDAILAYARSIARKLQDSQLQGLVDGDLEKLNLDHILLAARRGDPAATEVISEVGKKIGFAVSILINLFAPELVILGGPIGTSAGDLLLTAVITEASNRTRPRSYKRTRIVTGSLGVEALAIGAAILAINNVPIDVVYS